VKRTAEMVVAGYLLFSVVRFTDFVSHSSIPAMNRWATIIRPLNADWNEIVQSQQYRSGASRYENFTRSNSNSPIDTTASAYIIG